MEVLDCDVAIVGAGVVGCAIAARLSLDYVSVVVLERRHDVAEETSKSNTGVADSGWECTPGSLEATLVKRASPCWEEFSERFDAPFRRCGALSIARTDEEVRRLDAVMDGAHANGVRVMRLSRSQVLDMAPYVNPAAKAAIEVPDEGVIDSIRLTLGYAELAARNGVRFRFDQPVMRCERQGERAMELLTPSVRVRPRFVVNAAGLGADTVSRLLGAEEFEMWPRRGEYLLADREVGRTIGRIVTQPPTEHTRGVMVVPSTHGSVLLGPTATDDNDKWDRSTRREVLERVFQECLTLVPGLERSDVIKSFTGLRPASEHTYRVEQSARVKNLIHACGIRSTGVSSSPAMGDYVHDLLIDAGLHLKPRPDSIRALPKQTRLADGYDCARLAHDHLGRTIVCACEKVTALEIHNALQGAIPARSIAGVAKRTRATWGRCQGSACMAGVTFITSLYLPGAAWEIPHTDPSATLGVAEASRV